MRVTSVKQYTGLPFASGGRGPKYYDCWGLTRLFYLNEFGVELPLHAGMYFDGSANGLHEEIVKRSVRQEFNKVDDKKFGDLILIRMVGFPIHVGIRISPCEFIHADRKNGSIKTLESRWSNKIEQYYRHQVNMD